MSNRHRQLVSLSKYLDMENLARNRISHVEFEAAVATPKSVLHLKKVTINKSVCADTKYSFAL